MSPCKSPLLSSPTRGLPARGRGAGQEAGRDKPVGTVNPQPQNVRGKPGQAGFVQHGGSSGRQASRSLHCLVSVRRRTRTMTKMIMMMRKTRKKKSTFLSKVQIRPRNPVAVKNLNLIQAPKRLKNGFAEIARWNCTARQGMYNETKHGWMAKRVNDDAQRQHLRRQ